MALPTGTPSERMIEHLLYQFYDSPKIKAILDIIGEEISEIEKARKDVDTKIFPSIATGHQLDICGEIADLNRTLDAAMAIDYFGFPNHGNKTFGQARFRRFHDLNKARVVLDDDKYRLAIRNKIYKNWTDASREATIQSLQGLFGEDTRVVLGNAGNAKVRIGIGVNITNSDINLINAMNTVIRCAGVGVKYVYSFDGNKTFGFSRIEEKDDAITLVNHGMFKTFGRGKHTQECVDEKYNEFKAHYEYDEDKSYMGAFARIKSYNDYY